MFGNNTKKILIIALTVGSVILSGCTKEQLGTTLGAGVGALAGSAFGKGNGRLAATAIGGVFGAVAGNAIGKSMDESDRKYYDSSSHSAFESQRTGSTTNWRNPDSGNYGSTTIQKTYQSSNGNYCREFTQKIFVGGKESEGYGTACRQPDGSWKIIQQ